MPPPLLPKAGRRPPIIQFPEDDIVRAFYRRHPGASLEPINLGSFEPSVARRFAARQLDLMKDGKTRREARDEAEREFAAAAAAAKEGGLIDKIQREEESHLRQALKTYTDRHGHKPHNKMGTGANVVRPRKASTQDQILQQLPAPSITAATDT